MLFTPIMTMLTFLPVEAQVHRAPQDATQYEVPDPAKPARIAFQLVGNEVRIEANVNGAGPFRLIVDTGMPIPGVLLFRNERVDALHLEHNGQHVRVAGAGGNGDSAEALMASGVAVAVGELKMSNASALVISKPDGFPPGVDGVIGAALFARYVVHIDVDASRMELRDPAKWTPAEGSCVIPLEREEGRVFVDVRVAVGSEEPVRARVVVDIGAAHALSLNTRDGRFAPPANAIEAPLGRGVSGTVLGKLGRLRRVEIGSFSFDSVVAAFPVQEHQKPGGVDFRDGNLGAEILKRFNLTFDYAGKRLVLEKAKGFSEAFEHEMIGLSLDWDKGGSLVVDRVLPQSPAADAEIEPGDQLISIDDHAVESLGENGLRRSLTAEGAEIKLALKRGDRTIQKKLRLRRLV